MLDVVIGLQVWRLLLRQPTILHYQATYEKFGSELFSEFVVVLPRFHWWEKGKGWMTSQDKLKIKYMKKNDWLTPLKIDLKKELKKGFIGMFYVWRYKFSWVWCLIDNNGNWSSQYTYVKEVEDFCQAALIFRSRLLLSSYKNNDDSEEKKKTRI